ncbi:DUF7331 family protein [Haladaptatus caseinilyticus]|nr:hypothetical protein [Haladaptatus caseinilyticus]
MSTTIDESATELKQTEYLDGTGRVVMIYDPENPDAWIRSCMTYPVER